MLEKNDYPVDIKKERKKILSLIGKKKIVTFQLVNSLSKVNKTTNKREYKRRHIFETVYIAYDDDGNTDEYRFYKTKRQDGKNGVNNMKYSPEFLMFEDGKLHVNLGVNQNENLDLFLFLINHPRKALNSRGEASKRPLFYMVDENAEAREYASKKMALAEMDSYLWNPSTRLPDEDLFTIAKALRISGADDMDISRIQQLIEKSCKGNPERFLTMRTINKETEMRATIQSAVEKDILLYDAQKMKWFITGNGDTDTLCAVRRGDDETSTLVHFLKNEDDLSHYDMIVDLIKDVKKAKMSKSKEVV